MEALRFELSDDMLERFEKPRRQALWKIWILWDHQGIMHIVLDCFMDRYLK